MVFTLTFVENLFRLLLDGAPLFIGLSAAIAALAVAVGRIEGWNLVDSVYYGFITATTVGYGDIVPKHVIGKLVSILLPLIGLVATGIMVALAVEAADITFKQLNP